MTPTGIEPVLPPWKGDVLTAWPWSHNSPSRARTYNNSVNSRVLYHWAIEEYWNSITDKLTSSNIYFIQITKIYTKRYKFFITYLLYLQNRTLKSSSVTCLITFSLFQLRLSPRPISDCQLNILLCLHLSPIYLIVFKGSYLLGYLILRGASRLDAFSVYPCRTWLLCHRLDV